MAEPIEYTANGRGGLNPKVEPGAHPQRLTAILCANKPGDYPARSGHCTHLVVSGKGGQAEYV